jgi:SnoaL-like domain
MAILALYAEYNRSIDAADIAGWLATFVEDGVFHHPLRSYGGQAELHTFITNRSAQLSTNPVAELMHWNDPIVLSANADSVTGSCRLMVCGIARESGKPEVVARGRYQDSLVRTKDGWRFKDRRLWIV